MIASHMIQGNNQETPNAISNAAQICKSDPELVLLLSALQRNYSEQVRRELPKYFSTIDIKTLTWFLGISYFF